MYHKFVLYSGMVVSTSDVISEYLCCVSSSEAFRRGITLLFKDNRNFTAGRAYVERWFGDSDEASCQRSLVRRTSYMFSVRSENRIKPFHIMKDKTGNRVVQKCLGILGLERRHGASGKVA